MILAQFLLINPVGASDLFGGGGKACAAVSIRSATLRATNGGLVTA